MHIHAEHTSNQNANGPADNIPPIHTHTHAHIHTHKQISGIVVTWHGSPDPTLRNLYLSHAAPQDACSSRCRPDSVQWSNQVLRYWTCQSLQNQITASASCGLFCLLLSPFLCPKSNKCTLHISESGGLLRLLRFDHITNVCLLLLPFEVYFQTGLFSGSQKAYFQDRPNVI